MAIQRAGPAQGYTFEMTVRNASTSSAPWKGQRVILAGGSGFLGTALARHFVEGGAEVVILTRSPGPGTPEVREVGWDGRTSGAWAHELEGAALLVNLAGYSVNCRHTPKNRRRIVDSRVQSVEALGAALALAAAPPKVWVQASGVGCYGDTIKECDEGAPRGTDFLADVCRLWEEAFARATAQGVRGVVARLGMVLGPGGGAYPLLERLVRLGVGGAAGSGRQPVSWIHLVDVVKAIDFLAANSQSSGIYNITAPNLTDNAGLMVALRAVWHRPWIPPAPAFLVRLAAGLIGMESSLVLGGVRAVPRRLLAEGFSFRFPGLPEALGDLAGPRCAGESGG